MPLLAAALRFAFSGEVAELLTIVAASVSSGESGRTGGFVVERVLVARERINRAQQRGRGEDLTGRLRRELVVARMEVP